MTNAKADQNHGGFTIAEVLLAALAISILMAMRQGGQIRSMHSLSAGQNILSAATGISLGSTPLHRRRDHRSQPWPLFPPE